MASTIADDGSTCYAIHRIGKVTEDQLHYWNIRVTSPSGQVTYEGQCLPHEQSVIVSPSSLLELLLTPRKLDR